MIEFIEDENGEEVSISNVADWMRFNTPVESKSTDPFKIEGEDLTKVSGLGASFRRKMNRDLQKRFQGIDGTETQQNLLAQAITGYAMFDLIEPPYNLDYLSQIYESSPYNYAAINAKVSNIVGLGHDFVETRKTQEAFDNITDEKALERARRKLNRLRQDLYDWLEECNEEETFTETLIKAYTDVEATGNGYLEIGRTSAGKIGYIGHIPAKTMRVRRLRDGFIQLLYGKAVYFRNFGDQETPNPIDGGLERPNEIIHLKKYTPTNNYYGIPDIIASQNAMAGNEFAGKYNLDYFENKAVPRYIITVKGAKLSTESERKLLEFFQVGLRGKNHRSLYIPLPPDSPDSKVEFKMEPIENGIQEASFNEYRVRNRDDILVAHQVPISKLGGSDSGSIASALAQDRTFKEQVARPAQQELEKLINKVVREKTDILELKFNELTLTDEIAQSQILERYVKTQVMMPNEAREKLGLPQHPEGDTPFVMSPRQATDARANLAGNKQRDAERTNNNSDSTSTISGRNPQGEGRSST